MALGNMKNPAAVSELMNLLDDEDVVGHAVIALGKLRSSAARPRLQELLRHPREWVRDEARKALEMLDSDPS